MYSRFGQSFARLPAPTPAALLAYGLWLRLAIGGGFVAAAGLALTLEPRVRWDLVLLWIGAGALVALLSWQRATACLGRFGEQLGAPPARVVPPTRPEAAPARS